MKKGFIGALHLGSLRGPAASVNVVDEEIGSGETELDAVFYTSAFQAGIEEFIVPYLRQIPLPLSILISERVKRIPDLHAVPHVLETGRVFANLIPSGWEDDENHTEVWRLKWFLIDLLDAMSVGTSILSSRGVPDLALVKGYIPRELFVPIAKLFSLIVHVKVPALVPRKTITTESLEELDGVLSSALFTEYASAQSLLDDSTVTRESAIAAITNTGKRLFLSSKYLLLQRISVISVLELSPKSVNSTLGKLPGTLGEMAADIGLSLLASERRIVIYDLGRCLSEIVRA